MSILKESLEDFSTQETGSIHSSVQSEVRYKLIIDCSEDSSLVRIVFKYGALQQENPRLYICGDFPGDRNTSNARVSRCLIVHT